MNWDVAKKLDRCCKSRGILIQLSLEEEDDELFGGGVDFTNALLDWRRSGEGVGGVGGAWGEGDSCLLLVPEDCMKLTLTERGNNNKEGGEVPSEIEVVEGGGGDKSNLESEGWSVHKVRVKKEKRRRTTLKSAGKCCSQGAYSNH